VRQDRSALDREVLREGPVNRELAAPLQVVGQAGELARAQAALLRAGADALRPGGTLVYSTCTISPAENEDLMHAFLAERDDFEAADLQARDPSARPVWDHPRVGRFLQTLPHRDRTDGFFIARLRRSA
jgi:16S rRNA (cytosine967-C5)-methyltransferase